ncbi:VIT domain-containing protein [Archangium sp.]|uniref:VIT domain-containing protein n=1 Tax=Archangium sp. TaxID=1872627 RepID=UPI00389B1A7B
MQPQTERITQGTLRTSTGQPLPLEHTDVKARLAGPVASVEVRQVFRNDTGGPIEAVYLFPMPHEASVYRMSFQIGERTVQGVIKEKEEARRAYEAARSEGRSATLLEQERPNLFTLSVANIPNGEKIEVTLGYQERLAFDDGEWRFVFPMVSTERYQPGKPMASGGTDQVRDGARIRPPLPASKDRAGDISLELELRPGRAIDAPRSPSHQVLSEPVSGGWRVRLSPSDSLPNRDFVLAWRAAERGVRPQAFFERKADKPGTFLLTITPPVEAPPDAIEAKATGGKAVRCGNCGGTLEDPGAVREVPGIGPAWRCTYCGAVVSASPRSTGRKVGLPRDVIFLVDRSASMRGGSLPQARRAVRMMLDTLGPEDGVQLFAFDHDRIPADGLGDAFLPRSPESIGRIDAFLAGLSARGGSELEEALERAAKLPVREGRTRIVVLLTDAAVGNEGRLLRRAPELLGRDTRLYVLGIGPAVNRYLVEKLARAGGGASDVLLPTEDIETVVPRFARRVRQAGPVLTELHLSWEDALPADVYPKPIPDLFGGQTVQVIGRFSGSGRSRLVLTGKTVTGEPFRQEVDVDLPDESEQVPGLERMWARLRIDSRLERLAREPSEASDIRLEVLGLALKHSLLSPYTALVAEDSEKRVQVPPRRVEVAPAEPAGAEESELSLGAEPSLGGALEDEAPGGASVLSGLVDEEVMFGAPAESAPEDALDGAFDPMEVTGSHPVRAEPVMPAAPPMPAPSRAPVGAPAPMRPAVAPKAPPPPSPAPAARPMPAPGMAAPSMAAPVRRKAPVVKEELFEEAASGASPAADAYAEESEDLEGASAEKSRGSGVLDSLKRLVKGRDDDTPTPKQQKKARRGGMPLRSEDSDTYSKELLDYAAKKGVGELDLVFLVDETGSMGAYIEEVKGRLLDIIDALENAPLCRSLRLGLVSYRDHPPQDLTFASRVVPLTSDIPSIRQGVERMQASGGGDGPESVTDGLYDLVRLDWRPKAARVVVWFGDAPPHGVEPSGDGFPQGCPCGHHWYVQAESCREMGITVYSVGCLPGLRGFTGAEDVFKTVAHTTRGLYLPLTQVPMLVPLIVGAAESELDRQRLEEQLAEVVSQHEQVLAQADEQERVRFLTDVLRQEKVRPRAMVYEEGQFSVPPLKFRELNPEDVEAGLDALRRAGRTAL